MSDDQSNSEIIAALAEEFVERYRQGERPPISEYTALHPELAEEIREFFTAVAMVENLAPAESGSFGDAGSDASSAALPALKQLGDFRIIREVGRGGMGVVYEAEQVTLGRHVALKVLPAAALPDDQHIRRFEREAKSAAKLHHTNIVPVFGVGTEDDLHYYVMQFIQGLPLDEVIEELKKVRAQPTGTITAPVRTGEGGDSRRQHSVADVARSLMTGHFAQTQIGESDSDADGVEPAGEHPNLVQTVCEFSPQAGDTSIPRLSDTFNLSGSFSGSGVRLGKPGAESAQRKPFTYWESVANIGLQVADAMQYAHEQGILHRDIKPSNLLLDLRGTAWVTDFGLAKATDQQDITHTGDILGTLRYMPPEAFEGMADPRSDVYSLGLTLYELLCFQPAFGMKDHNRLIKQVTTETAPRLEKLNPEIPRDLVTIVHKAIDREVSHRYQTARELQEDLQRFVDDEPIRARRISKTERIARWSRRNKGLAAALAVVCVLLLVINVAGPVMTYSLVKSQSELRATVTELQANKDKLEATGRQLAAETLRANQEAEDARSKAAEKVRIAEREADSREEADRQRTLARRALYSSSLFAAQNAMLTPERYDRAQELLDDLRPQSGEVDMRGWEWYYLVAQPSAGGLVLRDFSGYTVGVRFSPDGKTLAIGDSSGKVSLVNVKSGRIERTLLGHQAGVWAVAWNPDGTRLASASGDKTARIWNLETGEDELQLRGHTLNVTGVAWSPDGTRLATASFDKQVKTWDASSGENLQTFDGHSGAIRGVDWSSDGRRLASAGEDQTVRLWDVETGEEIHVLEGHTGRISRVRFSPDGRRIASASWESSEKPVIIWDAEQGRELSTLKDLNSGVWGVSWNSDGSRLATAGWNSKTADIWDARSGEHLHSFAGHQARLYECSWSPDGQRLASTSTDQTVRIWDVVRERATADFAGHSNRVRTLSWSPDGARLATASFDKTVKIWDVASRTELFTFDRHTKYVYCVDWNSTGTQLASCGQEQVFHVWEAETGDVVRSIRASDSGDVNVVAWSPDGTRIASAADDKSVRVFDIETGEEVQRFLLNDSALCVGWSLDGGRLAAGSYSGELKVWDVITGDEIASLLRSNHEIWTIRFNPDGTTLAAGGQLKLNDATLVFGDSDTGGQGTLILWNLTTHQEWQQLHGHTLAVRSVDWSGDGTRLLSAGHDGKLLLWDTQTGSQLLAIDDPDGQAIISARFSPDELQIASAGNASGIRLWDTTVSHAAELSPKLLPGLDARISREPTVEDHMLRGRILSAGGEWDRAAADFQLADRLRQPDDHAPAWIATSWWVAGPYPMPLDDQQPPETHLDPLKPIPSGDDTVSPPGRWQRAHLSALQGLNLGRIFTGAEHISAYAMTRVYASEEQTAGLLLGADDQARVWLNGTVIHTHAVISRAVPDDDVVEITLQPGWNTLLFKVNNYALAHGLFARLSQDPQDLARAFSRNGLWDQALTYWDRAYAARPDAPEVLLGRGRAALAVGRPDVATECFNAALVNAEPSAVRAVASAYAGHAQSLIKVGQANAAMAGFDQARSLYETLLAGEAATVQDAADLADVLLAHQADQVHWTVLEPAEMTSTGGATLTRLDDNSVLAGGPNPDHDVYHVTTAATDLQSITAIRIEALTDDSLPGQGPGRWDRSPGVFVMNKIDVIAASRKNPNSSVKIALDAATADYFYPNLPISPVGPWHIGHGGGKPHVAVYRVGEALQSTEDSRLTFTMTFNNNRETGLQLGRFRLSVTSDPAAFNIYDQRFKISTIEDRWARLGAAYAACGDSTQAAQWFARSLKRAPGFAARRTLVEQIDQLPTDLGDLVALRPDDPLLLNALAKRQSAAGQTEAAAKSLATTRRLAETLLGDASDWTVLEPIEVNGEAGETLTVESDGSIFVSGPNPARAIYTLTLPLNGRPVNAIRLETLPDARLPRGGAGRYPENGNFHLAEFTAALVIGDDGESKPIPIVSGSDDYHFGPNSSAAVALDGNPNTRWDTYPYIQEPHWAVFTFRSPVQSTDGRLIVTLDSGISSWGRHGLGRFRFSVTDSPHAVESPDHDALAGFLADLLLADTTGWTILEPIDMTSEGGATLTRLDDNSVLASGPNPDHDRYNLTTAPTDLKRITAIRLEALTDDSLPSRGPGRLERGRFDMTRIRVAAASPENPEAPVDLDLDAVSADYFQQKFLTPNGRWLVAVGSGAGGPCTAIYRVLGDQFESLEGSRLRFDMIFNAGTDYPGRNLGRFRISATDDPTAFETYHRRFTASRSEDPWERLGTAYATVGDSTQAAHSFARALERTPDFAARRKLVEWIDQLQTDLSDLVELRPKDPLLLNALAKRQSAAGQAQAATESFARARSLAESLLAQSPDDHAQAGFLADLLLADTSGWTVLEPVEMSSAGGATLTRKPDGSILAGGANPDSDSYELVMDTELKTVTAMRLEALTDDSLPNRGPGRGRGGNFAMSWTPAYGDSDLNPVAFDAVEADYSFPKFPINIRRWNVQGGEGRPHEAVYRMATPIQSDSGFRFRINMQFQQNPDYADQNLGRFRISVTNDPAAFDTNDRRFRVSRIADPWARVCSAYILSGLPDPAPEWFTGALQRVKDFTDIVELIDGFDGLQIDLHELVALRPDNPWLWSALAKQQASRGDADAAANSLGQARRVAEALLDDTHGWTVLDPTEMTLHGGATFSPQADGSILASGPLVSGDVYTIRAPVDTEVRAIRLEALPDPSLPARGPGRHASGNFQLEAFRVHAASGEEGAPIAPRPLANAWASFEHKTHNSDVLGTIDDNDPRMWHVFGRHGKRHVAVFELATPLHVPAGQPLIMQCAHRDVHGGVNLGRFRLSVTNDPAVVAAERRRWTWGESDQTHPDGGLAGLLADLVLADESVAWSLPKPVDMVSAGGAALELQSDGSIFVSGTNPDEDLYTVVLPLTSAKITAVRLETLADDRLPFAGSGRSTVNGNFRLDEFSLSLRSANDPQAETSIQVASACADANSSQGRGISSAVDGDGTTGWSTSPQQHLNHEAVFLCRLPPTVSDDDLQLVVRLQSGSTPYPQHGIGRFRLAVTNDPAAFDLCYQRFTVSRIEDPWERLAAAYHVAGNEQALDALLRRKPQAAMGIANAANWSEAIVRLDSVINAVRRDAAARARLLRLRGAIHLRAGQWERAAADYADSVELNPAAGSLDWMKAVALWAYAGDAEQHREWTRKMAERFRASVEAPDSERTVKVMLLLEHGLDPEQAPVERFLAALDGNEQPGFRAWFLSTRALLACRSGEFDEALRYVEESLKLAAGDARGSTRVLVALGVKALIHAKQGNRTAARATVDELKSRLASAARLEWRDDGTLDAGTILNGEHVEHDLLIPEILRREAERLIQ